MGRKLIHSVSVGDRFGRLEVIGVYRQRDRRNQLQIFCVCRCECGKEKTFIKSNIQKGKSNSCGCLRKEMSVARSTKHGHASGGVVSPENIAWQAMIQRCSNENRPDFYNYGGRGIRVCERWLGEHGFENFLADVGLRPSPEHSLDRFPDQNGNYDPGNVRWATKKEQARNVRKNVIITFRCETMCVAAWDEYRGFPRNTVGSRLRNGWSIERAILTPVKPRKLKANHV